MRRSSSRLATLRDHLRRRPHDKQAREAWLTYLLATPSRPIKSTPIDDILKQHYTERYLRDVRIGLSRSLFRMLPKDGEAVGLVPWLPRSES